MKDWINGLDDVSFKKVDKLIGLLKAFGTDLRLQHCRSLGDKLYELRDMSAGPGYRIYYTWKESIIVILLVAGDKSSQDRDIAIAKQRIMDKE